MSLLSNEHFIPIYKFQCLDDEGNLLVGLRYDGSIVLGVGVTADYARQVLRSVGETVL